jgi:fatty acid desaturase
VSQHPLKELREHITSIGLMKKPTMKSWMKVVALFGIVISLYFVHSQIPLYWGLLLIPITALFTTTLSMAGHEGVHASACNSRAGNISLAALVFPLFCGLSMEYWRDKHNVKHHAHPNVVNQDPDIHSWPLTFSQEEYEQSGKIRRFFQRNLQAYLFWPISLLVGHLMRWDGLKFLITHPFRNKKKRFTKLWALDSSLMLMHFFLWLGLPILLGVPWQITVGFYALLWALVGTYLTAIFIVGHAGRPIVTEYDENWRLQIETGRRIKTNKLTSFFFVGLDYQIEHHLLPSVSHFNLPKVAPIVKKYAEDRGWEYEEMGFFRALIHSTICLHRAWKTPSIQIDSSAALDDSIQPQAA